MLRNKQSIVVAGKTATLYSSANEGDPLVVLNSYDDDGATVVEAMEAIGAPDCSLLVVSGLAWDRDLSPWYCPPTFEAGEAYTGGADAYLELLLESIFPQAQARLSAQPSFAAIAGYSLAGLFALYSLYRCDSFSCAASVSGSLWFPDIVDYAKTHEMRRRPERLYLSLGDKEAKTRNPVLRCVRENTEAMVDFYREQGIDVAYELNPGNHFKDAALRTAKGIKAILE